MMLRVLRRAALLYGALVLGIGVLAICAGPARASEPGMAPASEPGRITVKRTAVVAGPTVTLGDVATLEGGAVALANVDLGPAPTPNAPRRLEGEAILRRLEAAGMDESATRYVIPATVQIEREAQEVGVEEIKTAVMNVAADALPAGETISTLDVAGPVRIPVGAYEARVSTASRGRAGRRRFDVELVRDGDVLATVPVTARTQARGTVVVTKQPVARGAVLARSDLAVVERDRRDVPDDALTAPEQAIGMTTKVALAADAPLPRAAIVPPIVVKKGDLVTMIVDTGVMRLSAAGEALEPGSLGAGIKVMNRTSKQTVEGKVAEHGVVVVQH